VEAADVAGNPAASRDRDLDLDLRRLTPLVQGGALAAATAASCPRVGYSAVSPCEILMSVWAIINNLQGCCSTRLGPGNHGCLTLQLQLNPSASCC
jgi:hypothetical protein